MDKYNFYCTLLADPIPILGTGGGVSNLYVRTTKEEFKKVEVLTLDAKELEEGLIVKLEYKKVFRPYGMVRMKYPSIKILNK